MEIEIRDGVVHVRGDLDMLGADALDRALVDLQDGGGELRIDASGLDFVDSAGLRSLLAASRRADAGRVVLLSPSVAVTRLLDITGTTSMFTIRAD